MPDAEMPTRIAHLDRTERGLPIPWFVDRPANRKVDFRVMNPRNYSLAIRNRLCWICGGSLGRYVAFTGGPLSIAQKIFADPPSHRDCTEYALKVCPFMAIGIQRRNDDIPAHVCLPSDHVEDNPGVFGLLITTRYTFGSLTFQAVDQRELHWYHKGRPATREEVSEAIEIARHRPEVLRHGARTTILRLLDRLPLESVKA